MRPKTAYSSDGSIVAAFHGIRRRRPARHSSGKQQRVRARLAERQNWRCCYCGVALRDEYGHHDSATIEHLEPRGSRPRTHNLVIACYLCNNGRGHFVAALEYYEIVREAGRWNAPRVARKTGLSRRPTPPTAP